MWNAYSSFSGSPSFPPERGVYHGGPSRGQFGNYRPNSPGGHWNPEVFLSDAPELSDGKRKGWTLGVGVYGSEVTSSDTLPSAHGQSSSSGVPGAKRPFVTMDFGEKRRRIESGGYEEEVDVFEVSLRNIKKAEGDKWFCLLCYVELIPGQNLETHFSSPEHARRAVCSVKGHPSNYPFFCQLCMATCTTEGSYQAHLIGKKHAKAAIAAEQIRALPAAAGDVVNEMKALMNETVLEEGLGLDLGISQDMQEFFSLDGPFIGLQHAVEIGERDGSSPVYHCTLCNVHVMSGNKALHFCSVNHRQQVLERDYPDKWHMVQSMSLGKSELTQMLKKIASEVEMVEGRKVELIKRRIVQRGRQQGSRKRNDRGGGGGRGKGANAQRRGAARGGEMQGRGRGAAGGGQGRGGEKAGGGQGRGAGPKKGGAKTGVGQGGGVAQGKGKGKAGKGQGIGVGQGNRGVKAGGGGKIGGRGLGKGAQGHEQGRRKGSQGQEYGRGSGTFSGGLRSGGERGGRGTKVWRSAESTPSTSPWGRWQGSDDGGERYGGRPELPYPEQIHNEPWQEDRSSTEWKHSDHEMSPSSVGSASWKQPYGGWGVVAQNQPSRLLFPPTPVSASSYPPTPLLQSSPPSSVSQQQYLSTPLSSTDTPLEQFPTPRSAVVPVPSAQQSMIPAGASSFASSSSTQGALQQLLQVLNTSPESDVLQNLATSLVRTEEDADVALKLSSALTQALLQYHINNAASKSLSQMFTGDNPISSLMPAAVLSERGGGEGRGRGGGGGQRGGHSDDSGVPHS